MGVPSDRQKTGEARIVAVTIYLRLSDSAGEEIALLARDDPAVAVIPRIGEEYVTAASYGVPVTGVEHDTTDQDQHHVSVFLDQVVDDPESLIGLHIESGWILVRDERRSDVGSSA